MKFTTFEIAEYVTGWMNAADCWHDGTAIRAALMNALSMLEDDQDGIEATHKGRIASRMTNEIRNFGQGEQR